MLKKIGILLMSLVLLTGCSQTLKGKHHVEIEVENYGSIQLELDADTAPITVTSLDRKSVV